MAETKRNPGEGERAARLGYVLQDVASAHLIHAAIRQRELKWIGLADRSAGVADDLVLGLNDAIIGHQFKNSDSPQPIGLVQLLLGASNYIAELATSYTKLRKQFSHQAVTIRFFSPDTASINDPQIKGDPASHTDNFLQDAWSYRTLENMRASKWSSVFEDLLATSGLTEVQFEHFWKSLDIRLGADADLAFLEPDDEDAKLEIEELSKEIPALIVNDPERDRWTRAELLSALNWRDPFKVRYSHAFPIGEFVQQNNQTETALFNALASHNTGYIGLVGSPGSGKSTLLQNALNDSPKVRVVRYLAYVPGAALGQGRGEAENMLRDVVVGLADLGLDLVQMKDRTLQGEQRRFENLLSQASKEHQRTGVRYVIVIDGLDHVPREEKPEQSFLKFLPLPQSLPDGVVMVLGTQRLDLSEMPPAVREQASEAGRKIEIAPLDMQAVSSMADEAGVDQEVSRQKIYEVTTGHPLVSLYFVKRMASADEGTQEELLDGKHGFDGDLEAIYASAWRGIESLNEHADVHRVLSLIGYAEGPIETKCLEDLTSSGRAVESAYREAAHLLEISEIGWTTFHNSFRLFLQSKPVQKYGNADPTYAPEVLYNSLANATEKASDFSPQRWLKLRYLLLAGDLPGAMDVGRREYFVAQFCNARRSSEICNDIETAISSLRECATATKLFELILTRDEIERRVGVMEGAPSLSRAYLSLGDLANATSALSEAYIEGDQWPVIEALMDEGNASEARRLFDHHSPYRRADDFGGHANSENLPWARCAIQFLSSEQLQRLLVIPPEASSQNRQTGVEDVAEKVRSIRFDVARAYVEAEPSVDLSSLAKDWNVRDEDFQILGLKAALSPKATSTLSLSLLRSVVSSPRIRELDLSWQTAATRTAIIQGDVDLAKEFVTQYSVHSLAKLDEVYETSSVKNVCHQFVRTVALFAELGAPVESLSEPKHRLFKGVQHHLRAIGVAIGDARCNRSAWTTGRAEPIIRAAISFFATARSVSGEDRLKDRHIPQIAEIMLQAAFVLVREINGRANFITELLEKAFEAGSGLKWSPQFRVKLALLTFEIDQDHSMAKQRILIALECLDPSHPTERIEQTIEIASALATIGERGEARALLEEIRSNTLAIERAAKKDPQYTLWNVLLRETNAEDSEKRGERAKTVLRLLDGLQDSEGSNMGPRIVRRAIFEAAAPSAGAAWSVLKWGEETGIGGWVGLVEGAFRGMLHRASVAPFDLLVVWVRLCLPWYSEPHGSDEPSVIFLREFFEKAELPDIENLERFVIDAIEERSTPGNRISLIGVVEEITSARGGGAYARAAKNRWRDTELARFDGHPDDQNYDDLTSFEEIKVAVEKERERMAAKDDGYSQYSFGYQLKHAVRRVIAAARWDEAHAFWSSESKLVSELDVADELVSAAMKAGDREIAMQIAEPLISEEQEGWNWLAGTGRRRKHEVHHMLEVKNAHSKARSEFLDDLIEHSYNGRYALWSLDAIFPLIFEEISYAELWEVLEPHIHDMHDFKVGREIEEITEVSTDSDLLASIFVWAFSLEIPLIRFEAKFALLEILDAGGAEFFCEVVRKLCTEAESVTFACDLLLAAREEKPVAQRFSPDLPQLAAHENSVVAATAVLLGQPWKTEIAIEHRELPTFYQMHFPNEKIPEGAGIETDKTRALIYDDPFAWTEGWSPQLAWIWKLSGVSEHHVRRRIGQLVRSWGGVEKFGNPAFKRLESSLRKLDLTLIYSRPQAAATTRAAQTVVGELWRANRLDHDQIPLVLHSMHSAPQCDFIPQPESRPEDVYLPYVPNHFWGEKREKWLDEVDQSCVATPERVLAEWYRATTTTLRTAATSEKFSATKLREESAEELDDALNALPSYMRIMGSPANNPKETSDCHIVSLDVGEMNMVLLRLIVFCPRSASALHWTSAQFSPHVYHDVEGVEMVRTIWWRDGLPQSIDEDAKTAEGQRVVFSEAGSARFIEFFGDVTLRHQFWRKVDKRDGEEQPIVRRTATH